MGVPTDFLPLQGEPVPLADVLPQEAKASEVVAIETEVETSGRQVPSDQELSEKLDKFRATHAAEYFNRDREKRAAFGRRLLEASRQTKHSRTERYILLNEARQIANRASDVETMLQAGRELASQFDVDAAGLSAAGVRDVLLRPVDSALRSAILEQLKQVMVQWKSDGKRDDAQKLLADAIGLINSASRNEDENVADTEITKSALQYLQLLAERINEGNAGS